MSRFDNALRQALRRRRPPRDFAERVVARAREVEAHASRRRLWSWSIAAVAVLILAAAPVLYQKHGRDVQGQKAKEDVIRSLTLAGTKLRQVQDRLAHVEDRVIDISSR